MTNTSNAHAKLYEVLLAGELAACFRLIEESTMAPTTADRVAIARLIAAEMGHFERLSDEVVKAGGDPDEAVVRHSTVFDQYHRATLPHTWLEALVKMYIGDGLAADFYTELSDALPAEVADVMRSVLGSTGSSHFAVNRVREAIAADSSRRSPLALWGRRLLGEAITHMQWVLAEDDEVMDLLFTGESNLATVATFFDAIADRHAQRMADLGLA